MYIDKIVELLQKYINDYEKKKYELEVLITKKQLYEELIPLLDNKNELNDNKLFICVLLNSIFNNEEYNLEFYKALLNYNRGEYRTLELLNIKIKNEYNIVLEKSKELKKQLKNAYYRKSTAQKSCFYLEKRLPLYNQHFTYQNIKSIISYYAIMGEISDKEEVLLNNELEFYNNNIIEKQNKEKEYKTRKYNEVPNILNSGFEECDEIEVSSNRVETINSYVSDLKLYIKQINIFDIIPIIESYQKYDLEINEYNYIVNEILKMFLMNVYEYSKILSDVSIYNDRETRNEAIETYYDYLEKYMLLREYYNQITGIDLIEDEIEEIEQDTINPRKLVFSHPSSNPTKSKLIDDLKDIPEEYYKSVESLLQNFVSYKKTTKSFTNDKKKRGFIELKDDQVRIVLTHLKNNIYCIMGVFAKKTDNDMKMYKTMCNRIVTNINTKEKEEQELVLGEKTMQELSTIVCEKSRKGTR